jgi:hypothetical protein
LAILKLKKDRMGNQACKVLFEDISQGNRQATTRKDCPIRHKAKRFSKTAWGTKKVHFFSKLHPESLVREEREKRNLHPTKREKFLYKTLPL